MAWSINNVDFVTIVKDCSLFCGNRDATLVFLVHGVHDQSLGHFGLVVAEGVRLFQKSINKSRLAVVDMGDNCNVSDELFF